jgi:hypothetical protein
LVLDGLGDARLGNVAVNFEAKAKDLGQCVFDGVIKGHNTPVIALVALFLVMMV